MIRWLRQLFGQRHPEPPSPQTLRAKQRLASANSDDDAIDRVMSRTHRILRENSLAPAVMRALGVRRS